MKYKIQFILSQYTTVTNATLAYYFAPVIVISCSPILLHELLHERLSIKKEFTFVLR